MFIDTDLGDRPHDAETGSFDDVAHADIGVNDHDDIDHGAAHYGDQSGQPDGLDTGHDAAAPADQMAGAAAQGDLVVVSADGSQIDLGHPNLSYGGHGQDAVAVEGSDGTVDIYADGDHDGDVDVAVRIEPDGSFTAWTTDGTGHWTVQATGHVDPSGAAVVDSTIAPAAAGTQPSIASPATAGSDPHVTTQEAGYPGVAAGDIAVAADGHYIDAGPAKYDLDGDGHAETAVVEADGRIIQVSDTDGDGRADEMLQVDVATHQAAILTDDGSGHWAVAATGHIGPDGAFVQEHSAGVTEPSDPVPPAHPTTGAAPTTTEPTNTAPRTTEPTNPAPANPESSNTEPAVHGPDIVYTSADGRVLDLGAPTEDLNGDGVAESVAVRTDDGDILVLSDTNADGHPDQLIQIDPQSGTATWAVPDTHGGWDVVQTGHLEADGSLVVDHTDHPVSAHPDPAHPDPAPAGREGQDGHAEKDDNVEVGVAGRSFDAGPATIDSNGDGIPDTVSVAGPGGSTLFYQDSNGDGVADKAWTSDASGQVTAIYALAAGGGWVPVAPGGGS